MIAPAQKLEYKGHADLSKVAVAEYKPDKKVKDKEALKPGQFPFAKTTCDCCSHSVAPVWSTFLAFCSACLRSCLLSLGAPTRPFLLLRDCLNRICELSGPAGFELKLGDEPMVVMLCESPQEAHDWLHDIKVHLPPIAVILSVAVLCSWLIT